jgi:membrane protein DedA with SNARE-associated domain
MLTAVGLPIPEEVFIITAAVLASHGQLNPWLALASCLFGALAGDLLLYGIGRRFGRNLLSKQPWWGRFFKPEREARIEEMMRNHGLKVFFLARFLVGLRSSVYLSAGILRMSFPRFLAIALFCATTVILTFFFLGFQYGRVIIAWIKRLEILLTLAVLMAVGGAVFYLWRRQRRKAGRIAARPTGVDNRAEAEGLSSSGAEEPLAEKHASG